jgi:hypothetical protein
MNEETFDWKKAMVLFADGVELEWFVANEWQRLRSLTNITFHSDKEYRRAPGKEVTIEELEESLLFVSEVRENQRKMIAELREEISSLKEKLRVKEEERQDLEWKYDELARYSEPEITRLGEQLESLKKENHDLKVNYVLQNPFDKEQEAAPQPSSSVGDKSKPLTYFNRGTAEDFNRAFPYKCNQSSVSEAEESGKKTINSKEELSSSLHEVPSPVKQEESEPTPEECLEWLSKYEGYLHRYNEYWWYLTPNDSSLRSYKGSTPIKAILEAIDDDRFYQEKRSAMKSEVRK